MPQLVEFPSSLTDLVHLKWLAISFNKIASLPGSIARLTKLEQLYAAGNDIAELPEQMQSLNELAYLKLTNNRLTKWFPIARLTKLEMLDVRNNKLASVEPEVVNLPRLRDLRISGNPFENLPAGIANQNIEAIREYFSSGKSSHNLQLMLLQILRERFDETDLKDLAFELEIDYESLSGSNKRDKTREMIQYTIRRDIFQELVTAVRRVRPTAGI